MLTLVSGAVGGASHLEAVDTLRQRTQAAGNKLYLVLEDMCFGSGTSGGLDSLLSRFNVTDRVGDIT